MVGKNSAEMGPAAYFDAAARRIAEEDRARMPGPADFLSGSALLNASRFLPPQAGADSPDAALAPLTTPMGFIEAASAMTPTMASMTGAPWAASAAGSNWAASAAGPICAPGGAGGASAQDRASAAGPAWAARSLADASSAAMDPTWAVTAAESGARWIDAWRYDLGLLTDADRRALERQPVSGGDILVAHPEGVRSLARYRGAPDLALSIDSMTRIAAIAGPGVSGLGAAAFARSLANVMGEPVAAVAPSYRAEDLMRDMMFGPFGGALGPRRAPESVELARLLTDSRIKINTLVSHGRGGGVVADALDALRAAPGGSQRSGRRALAIATLGGPISAPGAVAAVHAVGGFDMLAWAFAEPGVDATRTLAGQGHHLNHSFPGALDLRAALAGVEPPPWGRDSRRPEAATVFI